MQSTGVSGGTITVYEGTQQQTQLLIGTHSGPYTSLAAANSAAAKLQKDSQTVQGSVKSGITSLLPSGWNLIFGNTHGLLTRGLKILFGGILIISGVLHMTGAANKVEGLAGRLVIPA
jgi:hypothetical protein